MDCENRPNAAARQPSPADDRGLDAADEAALRRLLLENPINSRGLVLRLAWLQGLTREELCSLQWSSVDLEGHRLLVGNREIPLCDETERCLLARQSCRQLSPYVVISDKHSRPYAPEAVSNMVRTALQKAGASRVRLVDLRHDYILRQIREHDWQYALRVSGLSVTTFQTIYAPLGVHKTDREESPAPQDAEYHMWKILQEQKDTTEGVALWLRWQLDLHLTELVSLTWEDVDFDAMELRLPTRTVAMPESVRAVLLRARERRRGKDPHVLLTPKSGKPFDTSRLSKVLMTVMIRGNISHASVSSMRGLTKARQERSEIMELARSKRGILLGDTLSIPDLTEPVARRRLRELVEEGSLVRVHATYYPAETTVPPERQVETIRAYLQAGQIGYLPDLAALLGLQERQCRRILNALVQQGILCKAPQGYRLPEGK